MLMPCAYFTMRELTQKNGSEINHAADKQCKLARIKLQKKTHKREKSECQH